MLILAIDTALDACSACVLDTDANKIIAQESQAMKRGHAEALMPLIARVMKASTIAFAALDRIAVTTGPGSFTGLRVGLSAARGIGLAAAIVIPSMLRSAENDNKTNVNANSGPIANANQNANVNTNANTNSYVANDNANKLPGDNKNENSCRFHNASLSADTSASLDFTGDNPTTRPVGDRANAISAGNGQSMVNEAYPNRVNSW